MLHAPRFIASYRHIGARQHRHLPRSIRTASRHGGRAGDRGWKLRQGRPRRLDAGRHVSEPQAVSSSPSTTRSTKRQTRSGRERSI